MCKYKLFFIVLLIVWSPFGVSTGNDHLNKASQIRIVTTEEPPTNYIYQKKLVGTTIDIVEEIKKYLNLKVEIEVKPWARSYKIAKEQPNVVIFTAGRSQERIDHGFHFIGPVITRKHALWKKKGRPLMINNLKDIKTMNLNLGSMRGDWRTKFFKDQGIKVQEVANHEQNLVKLVRGRFDLWVSSDLEAPPILAKLGYDTKAIELAYVFKEASSYIMISRDTSKEIVEKWQHAYSEIQKTNFFEKASKKWSQILGFRLGYSTNKGFFVQQ